MHETQTAPSEVALERPFDLSAVGAQAWTSSFGVAGVFAAAACLLHFYTAGHYGYFRDELYYAACGQHLARGYVDQAPLIAVVAWFTRHLLGDSLFSLRFFPALASGAKILLAAWMVRELNGDRFAQLLAATAMFFCPIYLTMDNFLSMNAFEPLFWAGCAAIAMRIAGGGSTKLWLLFGTLAGIGILNKHSMLFFGLAIFLGILVSAPRLLRNPWIWLAAGISFLFFLPNLLWEIHNHYPTIEILQIVDKTKNASVPWYAFIAEQALLVHPVASPICLAGLWFFFGTEKGRPYRFLGWTYVFILVQMIALRGRIYYVAPVYPILFAAGSVWIAERVAAPRWNWAKTAMLAMITVGGLIAAPLAMPLLPVNAAMAYANFWDVKKVRVEKYDSGPLPQFFADMFGWHEQVEVVASVFRNLTPQERSQAAILASNYGEAGAIDYWGAAYGLPRAISGHNNYFFWGPRGYSGDLVIAVGMDLKDLQPLFGDIRQVATIGNPYAIPEENHLPVYLCRMPRMPLSQAWPRLKFFG